MLFSCCWRVEGNPPYLLLLLALLLDFPKEGEGNISQPQCERRLPYNQSAVKVMASLIQDSDCGVRVCAMTNGFQLCDESTVVTIVNCTCNPK